MMQFKLGMDSFSVKESGDDMELTIEVIGSIEYKRRDSKQVALLLEHAASLVRERA
jgi:hypothetical protein